MYIQHKVNVTTYVVACTCWKKNLKKANVWRCGCSTGVIQEGASLSHSLHNLEREAGIQNRIFFFSNVAFTA